ncbi:hypothetical protein PENTCL1PPCAC_13616 [Pristionchus entomophagus]|uniref:G protein-coupled receptor n=1 Tax=Pristionchus entomophagus TaxID=358040 RepID=A0AAV5T7B6_9BILA|nr:hypothetical protein PENTCL1PPCAC_13616 [Pristionchus entomophagus]
MAETTTPFYNESESTTPDFGYDTCVGAKFMSYPEAMDFLFTIYHYNTVFAYVLSVGIALYILIFLMTVKLMYECWKIKDENIRGDIILCLSTPFIVGSTCLASAIFPRADNQMTTFGVAYMMFALWRALSLIFRLYGDTQHMSTVMTNSETKMKLNVIPLCCCCCLPMITPKLATINVFKYLVLQTPLIRLTILASIDVIRTEGLCDWTPETKILNLVDSLSTFLSLYASAVFVYASNENLKIYGVGYMMRGVTLTQTIFNLQRLVFERLTLTAFVFPDQYFAKVNGRGTEVIEARVQADFWQNIVMLVWLILICLLFLVTMRPAKSELFTMDKIPIAHVDIHGHFPHLRSIAPSVLTVNGGVMTHPKGSVNEGYDHDHHDKDSVKIEMLRV